MHSGKYEDPSFPADMSSLYWNRQEPHNKSLVHLYKRYKAGYGIVWKRPDELEYGKPNPSLWGSKGIRPDAIAQRGLKDCWLLSTIAAIAEWPERVEKIFNGL